MALILKKNYSSKVNAASSFAGSVWVALLNIIFVPFYLRYIGVESYGLIGIFTSVQAFIVLLDFGLSPTLNRELARLSVLDGQTQEMHDIKRTLEVPNWISAAFIALLFSAIAPLLARYWIQPKDLSVETVTQALIIMSVNVAVQFSMNFYVGGLMGLQKQVVLGLINIFCWTLRSVGAFLILAFVSRTIQSFLLWQGLIALIQVVIMYYALKYSLPDTATKKGRFQMPLLRQIGRFAIGMTGITAVVLVVTQTDKVILSRMLDLETFGYYALAITISSMAISMVVSSITHVSYPQFSRFVSVGDKEGLKEFYHRSCQIMSVFLFPVVFILTFFSYDILLVWIGKEEIAANTYILLSLVAIGNGLNSLMWLPHTLQLAHGWTKLALYTNLVTIIFLVPLIIIGVYNFGAMGGAAAWIIVNISYFFTTIQIMHRRILPGEKAKWFLEDLAIPFFTALTVAGAGRMLLNSNHTKPEIIIWVAIISALTLGLTALSAKAGRNYLKLFLKMMARMRMKTVEFSENK